VEREVVLVAREVAGLDELLKALVVAVGLGFDLAQSEAFLASSEPTTLRSATTR